ncbi:tetratricopeptide repeat protein [Saccharothrix xinjiangensis]|uniref:Tetratricopeptide repeat protein n=2 Tax=Saccharothrix xinjiangensis TaxID=204798 RepID=A0ABV9XVJ3_9PSEU
MTPGPGPERRRPPNPQGCPEQHEIALSGPSLRVAGQPTTHSQGSSGTDNLHTAHAARGLLDPHTEALDLPAPEPGSRPLVPPNAATALTWFDTEHQALLAVQRTAFDRGWWNRTWQLAWTLTTFHYRRGRLHDDVSTWQLAAAATDRLGPGPAAITARRHLGHACARTGRSTEALNHLHRALANADALTDRPQQAHTHRMLALTWWRQGDDHRARDHARAALRLFYALDDRPRQADAENQIAWYSTKLGDHDTARASCARALALYRAGGDRDGEASTLDTMGHLAGLTGDHTSALEHYRDSLTLFQALGHAYKEANTLDRLGHTHAALGHTEDARLVWTRAIELYRDQQRTTATRGTAAVGRPSLTLSVVLERSVCRGG